MPLNIKGKFGSNINVGFASEQPQFALQVSDGSTLTAQIRILDGEAPVNTVAPSISGNTQLGATLTRVEGTWTGDPEPTITGQWQRDGVAITGETGATYTITLDDNGADITYLETAENSVDTVTAVSNTITVDTFTVPDAFGPGDWDIVVASAGVQASGGVETVINPDEGEFYRVHTFLESGDLTVTQGGEVEYLVVAGGGGGGKFYGGGGGAGGLLKFVSSEGGNTSANALNASEGVFPVIIGLGGESPKGGSKGPGLNGQNTEIFGLVAIGGGGGGEHAIAAADDWPGRDGGSGGGGGGNSTGEDGVGGSGTSGQGSAGGDGFGASQSDRASGGGGGAGEKGDDAILGVSGGNGGDGIQTAISGDAQYYAGGGGGAARNVDYGRGGLGGGGDGSTRGGGDIGARNATSAVPNTGGGGGGTETDDGDGGSGIVIIRYPITEAEYNAEAA